MEKHKKLAGVLTGIFVVTMVAYFAFGGAGDGSSASTTKDPAATAPEEDNGNTPPSAGDLEDDFPDDLRVRPGDILPDRAKCVSDDFVDHSLREVRSGDSEFRQWSDAVSIPYESSDKDEVLDEEFAENCGNPTALDGDIQMLSGIRIGGSTIGEENPWMGEFLATADDQGFREAFLTRKAGEGDRIFVTPEYQEIASMVNTIFLRYENAGVEARQSVRNWHLAGPVAGELPRVVENPDQEGLPALVLVYTRKDNCPESVIGFNISDKRSEEFPVICEEPPKPPAPPTPEPPCQCPKPPVPPTTVPPCKDCPPVTTAPPTTVPPCKDCPPVTPPPTTVPPTQPPTTVPPCGDKNRWDPVKKECVPNLPTGSTVPPPPVTTPTATTVQPAPTPPATAPPDPTPPGVTVVDVTPPPNTYTPPGAVVGTTQPPATVAPPATPPVTAPPGGGSTPSR